MLRALGFGNANLRICQQLLRGVGEKTILKTKPKQNKMSKPTHRQKKPKPKRELFHNTYAEERKKRKKFKA